MRFLAVLSSLAALCSPAFTAHAANPTGTAASDAYWYLAGDASQVRNEEAAAIVSYTAGRTAESIAQLAGRTPILWARYNPGEAVGQILVARALRQPDGTTQVRLTPFSPQDGAPFAAGGATRRITYFGGINPFAQFSTGDPLFRGINFTAFLAATGLAMRAANASIAFIFYAGLTPTRAITAAGSELQWSANGAATYTMRGRWLLGLQGEAGDRRGFIPAYRVLACDPLLDPRNGCVVKGFASFVPWDNGNLGSAEVVTATRTGSGSPDIGAMAVAFEGLEGYLRDASLWSSWSSISGSTTSNALYAAQLQKIGEGVLGRRDRMREIDSHGEEILQQSTTYGVVTASIAGAWSAADAATSEFILKPLEQVPAGLGAVSTTTTWKAARDAAAAQDVRLHRGTAAAARIINDTNY